MSNWYIYARDYSGSTSNNSYFHSNALKTFYSFKKAIADVEKPSKIVYLHWDTKCEEIDEATTVAAYKNEQGRGGTCPQTIPYWIKEHIKPEDSIKLLYIITDGLISNSDLDECVKANENMVYEKVVFHAINSNKNSINTSVAAPFLQAKCEVFRNNDRVDNVDISEEYNYDGITLENFDDEKEKLKSYIKLKFLINASNSASLLEIGKLRQLRSRLFKEIGGESIDENDEKSELDLNIKDKSLLLERLKATTFYKNLFDFRVSRLRVSIDNGVSTLINYINNEKKSFDFNAIKFESKFSKRIKIEKIDDSKEFSKHEKIEFPDIILFEDKGVPVIILTEVNLLKNLVFARSNRIRTKKPINTKTNFSKFRGMMECPLFLLQNNDLSDSIGYHYTLNVYKQLLEGDKCEPRTRKQFHGGIIPLEDFDKYNDYILALTYFEGKKVHYNAGLFYYVLYKICEGKEWLDSNVKTKLKEYAFRRIEKTTCRLGLSSLPLDPPDITSLLTALWYCVELSSYLYMNHSRNFVHERLRIYYENSNNILEILEYFNYDLDKTFIQKRVQFLDDVNTLKRIFPDRKRLYHVLKKIFKQDSNGFLIAEITNPENIKLLNLLKLDHRKMLPLECLDNNVNLNHCVHLMYTFSNPTKICPNTYRPFFKVEKHSYYSAIKNSVNEISIDNNNEIKFNKVDKLVFKKILPLCKLYIDNVQTNKKYPTLEEFIEYVKKKLEFNKDLVTVFPPNISEGINNIFSMYSEFNSVNVSDFIAKSKQSVERIQRVKQELINEDNLTNDEIKAFILDEEKNAILTKHP